ncbi:MAG: CDP-alcohol phosphatidyltransferase family protein [Planctomycetes bacterium]|nr:CDP-alcohol phosphatidyltransferase family protein [Planctomycetota bacterium]
MAPQPNRPRRLRDLRSVPVLPSLITLGNLYFGFLAMAKVTDVVREQGMSVDVIRNPEVLGHFEIAAFFLFLAMVFDALDGRVARMTNQTTAFGGQLDSLADVVTFGVAPAFCAKVLINLYEGNPDALLPPHPKVYYFCAAVYVLCAAMRLARFNVEAAAGEGDDHLEFRGLPTPGAAAVVAAVLAFWCSRKETNNVVTGWLFPPEIFDHVVVALPGLLVLLGLAMVSKLPYPHAFGLLVSRRAGSFPLLASLVLLIGLCTVEWQLGLLVCTLTYLLSGPVVGLYRLVRRGRVDPPDRDGEGVASSPSVDLTVPGRY